MGAKGRVIAVFLIMGLLLSFDMGLEGKGNTEKEVPGSPAQYDIILEREQADGSIIRETKRQTVWAVEDFWNAYKDWELVDQNEQRIIFRKSYEKQ
ncbi:BofC N-terminal domain-containing protein [Bacillus piscicola]|uniref:BofC N-terminal domain-containing protein n=1 Tax=Bacillus piscicola TaxID=1632684 RepID=UPI001F09F00B|nr:BofC N-terminal domain-containing protein [Bacillus piscicola]